ncbi:MAG: cell surface protein SprA [bacterium]|nr:MAG: cell surface protein SprA [bacterium]
MISIFFSSIHTASEQGLAADNSHYLGLKLNSNHQYGIPLFTKQPENWLSMDGAIRPLLKLYPRSFKRNVTIDSTGQSIAVEETIFDIPLHVPAKYPLKQYTDYYRQVNLGLLWQSYKIKDISGDGYDQQGGSGLEIAIPVRIRSRAFQTIFGGDRVSLSVTGQININGGLRQEKRSQVRDAFTRGSNYNFKMQQTQNFKVQGNVGDKVTVSVDQDSERPFDFENTVRLNYQGYDDEIIQSIQAGNISLSLPATRFVSFSAQNSGLFGIKSEAQVGNFHLTTIASQEKGENKTLTITGGAEEGEYTIKDYNYMKGVYFLIDSLYLAMYDGLDKDGNRVYDPARIITNFEIYKSGPGYEQKQGRIRGWALLNPAKRDTSIRNSENALGFWIRLEREKDYFLWNDQGRINLFTPVSDNEMLGVAYTTQGNNFTQPDTVGDVFFDPQTQSTIFLKMLKPQSPRPSDETWDLMLRNVYYLGSRNIDPEGFEVKIFYDTPSGNDLESEGSNSYLHIFGLDRFDLAGNDNPDNLIDNMASIIRLASGELEFPRMRPFADMPAFQDGPNLPGDKLVTKMYESTIQSEIANDSKFYIQVKSKNKSANYDLGFNVIEGSEEVILNGRRLVKDTDYIIDYFSGKLTILREEATSPSANVEVNYQRNELFQLEKKTLLGMRGEYKFWENSFLGGTFLYLNQSTLDQKVRVGKGPMRNLIWDLNTSVKFEPNFLTKAIDAFPIIETKQPSRFNFEGEIAQILPNPNTLNNESTGDANGVAYIDDFEAAKKITPLGVIRNGWRECSSPLEVGKIPDPTNDWKTTFDVYKKRGRLMWWNPYEQVAIKEIWPNRDTHNPNTPQRVHVLDMWFVPVPQDSIIDDPGYRPEQSWNGIMRWLSAGYADQSDSKYLEIWVQGDQGKLHIDLGQISEDVIPNGDLDTEDEPLNGIRNSLLDPGEDDGLDGMAGKDPIDWWDINNNNVRDIGEPISYDDWEYSTGSYNYDRINGTEGNERDAGGRFPDTEDLNGNSSLDMRNDYFEYGFSLAKNHADTIYIVGGQDNLKGWRQYRIPLNQYSKKVGEPDMSRIEYARIWIDNCTAGTYLRIAEINIVGNDWKEMGVAPDDSSAYNPQNDTTVVAAVTNTHDNDDYTPPPGVRGVIDRVYRIESKEQSLVIKINKLAPGANGILRKSYFQSENYIRYKRMKMFVHGGDALGTNFSNDKTSIELFLRFGSDDNNYFEFRQLVFEGWEGNEIEIDLDAIAALKQKIADPITGIIDSSFADSTKHYRIKGSPSLTNIRQLVLGVKNISNTDLKYSSQNYSDFSGEIWVNELRLSEVRKDKGFAYRARAELHIADVFSINGEINQRDADFHNISERFGRGNNETAGNLSGNVSLHKFMPKSWGLSIPFNFNYSRRKSSPKYLPGSDILFNSAHDTTKKKSRSSSEKWGWGISFKKNTRSNNFFIKNTIDQISVSYNTAESYDTTSTHEFSTRKTYAANLSYSIPFPRDKYIRPFKWLGKAPIIKKIAELQFFYLPSSFSVRASGNRSISKAKTRTGVFTDNMQFIISRSIQTGIQPFKSLSVDLSRSYKNDLRNSPDPMKDLTAFSFGELTDMDQSFSTKYNPQLFSWLKTNLNYSTNFKFTNNLQLKDRGRNASNNTALTASFTFDPDRLVKSMFKTSPKTSTSRVQRRPPVKKPTETKEDQKKEEQQKKKAAINPFKFVLGGIQFVTGRIQPINMNMTSRKNLSQYGLIPGDGMPSTKYMFGLSDTTGINSVVSVGTNKGSSRLSTNISLSTGIKIMKQMDMSLKFNQDQNTSETTTTTGDKSVSWFYVFTDDKEKHKLGFPIPEWSIRWTGLEKFKFIQKFVQRVSFDHNFSGRKQESWQDISDNITRVTYTKQFRPVAGFNISLKNRISVNIRYNWSEDANFTVTGGSGGQKNTSSDLSITGSYSHSGGLRLPIPFMKNKELKNNVDVQVTFSWNKNASSQQLRDQDWTVTRNTESWNFEPRMTYSFSRNVRGGMNFKIGKNKNKTIGTTSIKEFGIHVNIIISGR